MTTMSNKRIYETMDDALLQANKILSLAMMSPGSMCNELRDFFRDEDFEYIEKVFGAEMHEATREAIEDNDFAEGVIWLNEKVKLGFLVQFATPVMKHYTNGGAEFSWGHKRIEWIYAETIKEAIEKGLKWVATERENEKKKQEEN